MPSSTSSFVPDHGSRRHVVLICFPAFGHIIPLLEFAKKIGQFHDVTFVGSTHALQEVSKRELIHDGDLVQLFGLNDGVKAGEGADKTDVEHGGFNRTFDLLLPAVREFLLGMPTRKERNLSGGLKNLKPVDVVIGDYFVGQELGSACRQRGVPFYIFNTGNMVQIQFFLALNDAYPTVPDHEANLYMTLPKAGEPIVPIAEGMKTLFLPMKNCLPLGKGIIVNSFRDVELDGIRDVEQNSQTAGLTIHCVGPLQPEEKPTTSVTQLDMERKVNQWLDKKPRNSVVYVSFGSVMSPSAEQLLVIGKALQQLGHPFVWSIREKFHKSLPTEMVENIVRQYDDQSQALILSWAPQKQILTHPAVSVFVSHCGWNSSLEAVSSGKPVVGWPLFADQLMNAEWIAKLGGGVVVADTDLKCTRVVSPAEIQDAIEQVGGWRTGKDSTFTQMAQGWAEKVQKTWNVGGSSYMEFQDLMKFDF